MAPKIPVAASALAGWRCPQCITRSLTTSAPRLQFGPEHPRFIEIPEPPQQTASFRPPIKGTLPVPRNVLSGPRIRANERDLALSTREPKQQTSPEQGTREEWKARMSDVRRRNLREGFLGLQQRQIDTAERSRAKGARSQAARDAALHKPEREDERLTAPSRNFDFDTLMEGPVPDPTRDVRLAVKRENVRKRQEAKEAKRQDDLHTLYMNARDFIVSPEQLDEEVEKVFGTDDNPVTFAVSNTRDAHSIWAEGRPVTIQEMLTMRSANHALAKGGPEVERMIRLAEVLTDGKMDTSP